MDYTDSLRKIWERDERETKKFRREFKTLMKQVMFEMGRYNKDDVEDIIQETYLRLCSRQSPPTISVKVISYMRGLAINIIKEDSRSYKEDPTPQHILERLAGSDYIIDQFEYDDKMKLLNRYLRGLGLKCQNLLQLFFRNDNTDEICRILNISSKSLLYKQKSQCMSRLQAKMKNNKEKLGRG